MTDITIKVQALGLEKADKDLKKLTATLEKTATTALNLSNTLSTLKFQNQNIDTFNSAIKGNVDELKVFQAEYKKVVELTKSQKFSDKKIKLEVETVEKRTESRASGGGRRKQDVEVKPVLSSLDALNTKVNDVSSSFVNLNTIAKAYSAIQIARIFTDVVDASFGLENRIRTLAGSQEASIRLFNGLDEASSRARTSLTLTGEIYSRLARSTEAYGKASNQVLDVTEALIKASKVYGNSSKETEAAIVQFSQGLASNRLGGDELRSVLEQAPRIGQALVDGLNAVGDGQASQKLQSVIENIKQGLDSDIILGDLRKLGSEGVLQTELVFEALKTQTDKINFEFASTIPSIGDQFTQLTNNIQKSLLSVDGRQIIGLIQGIFDLVIDNSDIVISALTGITAAWISLKAVTILYKSIIVGYTAIVGIYGALRTGAVAYTVAVNASKAAAISDAAATAINSGAKITNSGAITTNTTLLGSNRLALLASSAASAVSSISLAGLSTAFLGAAVAIKGFTLALLSNPLTAIPALAALAVSAIAGYYFAVDDATESTEKFGRAITALSDEQTSKLKTLKNEYSQLAAAGAKLAKSGDIQGSSASLQVLKAKEKELQEYLREVNKETGIQTSLLTGGLDTANRDARKIRDADQLLFNQKEIINLQKIKNSLNDVESKQIDEKLQKLQRENEILGASIEDRSAPVERKIPKLDLASIESEGAKNAIKDFTKPLIEAEELIVKLQDKVLDFDDNLKGLSEAYKIVTDAQDEYFTKAQEGSLSIEDYADKSSQLADVQSVLLAQSLSEANDSIVDQIDKLTQSQEESDKSKIESELYGNALNDVKSISYEAAAAIDANSSALLTIQTQYNNASTSAKLFAKNALLAKALGLGRSVSGSELKGGREKAEVALSDISKNLSNPSLGSKERQLLQNEQKNLQSFLSDSEKLTKLNLETVITNNSKRRGFITDLAKNSKISTDVAKRVVQFGLSEGFNLEDLTKDIETVNKIIDEIGADDKFSKAVKDSRPKKARKPKKSDSEKFIESFNKSLIDLQTQVDTPKKALQGLNSLFDKIESAEKRGVISKDAFTGFYKQLKAIEATVVPKALSDITTELDRETTAIKLGVEARRVQEQAERAVEQSGLRLNQVGQEEIEKIKQRIVFNEELANRIKAQDDIYRNIVNPVQDYVQGMQDLNQATDRYKLTLDQTLPKQLELTRAFLDTKLDEKSGYLRGLVKVQEELLNVAQVSENIVLNAVNNIEDAFVELATTGDISLDTITGLLKGIQEEAARGLFKQGANALQNSLFGEQGLLGSVTESLGFGNINDPSLLQQDKTIQAQTVFVNGTAVNLPAQDTLPKLFDFSGTNLADPLTEAGEKIANAGDKASSSILDVGGGFGSALQSIIGSVGSLFGGSSGGGGFDIGGLLSGGLSLLSGFNTGGSFEVPKANPGIDNKVAAFRVSGGERVSITRPEQKTDNQKLQPVTVKAPNVINNVVVDPKQMIGMLGTPLGKNAIMNTLRANKEEVKRFLN
jgi:tape measure domain-containing protein